MRCNKIARANALANLFHDLIGAIEQRDRQPSVVAVLRLRINTNLGPVTAGTPHRQCQRGLISPLHEAIGECLHEAHQRIFFPV